MLIETSPSVTLWARCNYRGHQWRLLPDDIWAHIIGQLKFRDKLRLQQTCRRFNGLLATPFTSSIWGRIEVVTLKGGSDEDVWKLCKWVQQRRKGIDALHYIHDRKGSPDQRSECVPAVWHALVASTAGTCIRLRLTGCTFVPPSVLRPPSCTELVQRLTALDMCVKHASDIAVVHSLVALRHLRLGSLATTRKQLLANDAGNAAQECQLTRLHTLRLVYMFPEAFFLPGTADCLQRLCWLRLLECPMTAGGGLPPEMLRLPSLSRLEILQLPLHMMPDLRGLPALNTLVMSGHNGGPQLDASQAQCSAELKAALQSNPLGGAVGLTAVILHALPIATQQCAEGIEQLPCLKVLALDLLASEVGAFWAATLQQRMRGRLQCHTSIQICLRQGWQEFSAPQVAQ